MYNVKNLISQFAWVDIATVRMVGDVWNVERTDVRYVRKTLEKVVLS